MSIFRRLGRLVKADIHEILDCLEEPEAILKQALREMEEELHREQQSIAAFEERGRQLEARKQKLNEDIAAVQKEIELCIQAGKDDLARSQLRRRLERERLFREIEEQSKTVQEALHRERETFRQRNEQFESLKIKTEVFVDKSAESNKDGTVVRDEDIEVALLREKERVGNSNQSAAR